MGDADVGASSLDSGDAGGLAASRALMEGGSLPPRKRLLAGLKQNGWLSTSPPPADSPTGAGGYANSAPANSVGIAVAGKYEEGCCMGCSAVESTGLRRIKRGGVSLRLCSACTLLYSKSMFCPHCLAMYHDASLLGDPSMWLVCTRCRRSVHPECEQKHSGKNPDAASYVCLDCVNRRQRDANGVSTGMRSKHSSSGRPVPNFHGETTASPVDFVSPALKKPRLHRRPGDHGDSARFERHRPGPDAAAGGTKGVVPPRKVVSSQAVPPAAGASPQEAAVAARNAATAAAKVAAAAKANAAAKASAAVKLAAAAKAALEAAAHAAKAEAACRAELRRKMGKSETRLAGGGGPVRLEINVHSEPRRERSSRGEMKYEGDDGYGGRRAGGTGSLDDEELARQLHRAINSSPRISRSMTPLRRKASVKPETPSSGVSNSSAETVRARPRPSPAEPAQEQAHTQHEHEQQQQQHHQFRHQQTRPRSVTHKEFRRIESRVSRHEVKPMADEGNGQGVGGLEPLSQEAAMSHMGAGQPAEDLAVKSEAMDGVMFAPVGVQDDANILFDALVEADNEGMHAAAGTGEGSHDRRPDYLQEILEAAVLTDSAMFNDGAHHDLETVRPEPAAAEQALETSSLQVEASEAGPKGAHGEASDGMARESVKEISGEVTIAMAGDAVAVESGDAAAGEAGSAVSVEAGSAVSVEAMPLEQDEEHGSAVVHDVEMQEVVSVDAAPASGEDETMLEPSSTSGARVEESLGVEPAAEETRIGMDASTPETVGAKVPSEETKLDKLDASEIEAPGVMATDPASQQSG